MAKVSNEPLQPNPFITYRDPKTGLWLVRREIISKEKENSGQGWKGTASKGSLFSLESI
jgi:hypothetical protein